MDKLTKEACLRLLVDKRDSLAASGDARLPKRSDFGDAEVCAIKARLGPWPRALEAAGIKAPRDDDRRALNVEKRVRAKRRRLEMNKAANDNGQT